MNNPAIARAAIAALISVPVGIFFTIRYVEDIQAQIEAAITELGDSVVVLRAKHQDLVERHQLFSGSQLVLEKISNGRHSCGA